MSPQPAPQPEYPVEYDHVDAASLAEALECVLVRSDNEAVVVNLDIEPVEKPERVLWVDPIHKDHRTQT